MKDNKFEFRRKLKQRSSLINNTVWSYFWPVIILTARAQELQRRTVGFKMTSIIVIVQTLCLAIVELEHLMLNLFQYPRVTIFSMHVYSSM